MGFKKGEVVAYAYPKRDTTNIDKSNVIHGAHRAVVLHKRETPYRVVLVAPITKATALEGRDAIPENYMKLSSEDYPGLLNVDSYVNLDMIMAVDEDELNDYQKNAIKISVKLNDFDLYQLDYKITLTYELSKYMKTEFDIRLSDAFEAIVEYIDFEIKTEIEKVLGQIEDPKVIKDVIGLIDLLLSQIKANYIHNDRN